MPRFSFRNSYLWFALSVFVLGLPAFAQDAAQRLILKDGSYQLAAKYEVKGDRVRYYSSEREEWEEIPCSLVDWPATEKYEKDRAASAASPEAVQLDKEAEHERELEETPLPQVAPGLRLPEDTGVFLLDTFQGQPQIVEIQQSAGDLNRNVKGNIFRSAIPLAGMKATVELDGTHAPMQAHVSVPSLYIRLEDMPDASSATSGRVPQHSSQPQQPQQPEQASVPFDHFRIVKVQVKGNKRIVLDLKRTPDGKVAPQHFVKTNVDRVTGGWLKLTPSEPLASGEYAMVEMVSNEGVNMAVWDFGVNPKAAANANPWKPDVKDTPKPQGGTQ
ncbi:MAG TPA: hypothetical protein VKV39_20520 [Candidatus Sulfotelmatobacter sp.]|nr:hypothetical protein [Candidatus Sulfotelmatobacter sp.]